MRTSVLVTSQGSLHFQKAIARGDLLAANAIAHELGGLAPPDALELVGLIARRAPHKLEPAALRWHGRLELEAKRLTLSESQFALAALKRLPTDPETLVALKKLLRLSGFSS
jgi:hypothetical protein